MVSRRQLLRSAVAAGIVPLISPALLRASQATRARIGDDVVAFTREFGAGEQEGQFIVFGDRDDDLADYWVYTANTDLAEMVEIDFSPIPGGGLPSSRTVIGWSRFLRNDAITFGPIMQLGGLNPNRHNFHVLAWHSESLAADLDRSGNVIVVDEDTGGSSVSPVGAWNILRTQASMETFNVHPINRTDTHPGPTHTVDHWALNYSLTERADKLAYVVDDPPIPGLWLVGKWVYELDISFDEPISVKESSDLVGSMLPEAGTEAWTTYYHPTPNAPYGMRVNGFNLGLESWPHYVLRYVKGTEADGTVDRIVIRAENPVQRGR